MSQSEVSRREQALIEAHSYGGTDMSQLQKDRGGGGKDSRGFDNPNGTSQRQKDRGGGGKESKAYDNPDGPSQRQKDRRGGGKESNGYDNPDGPSQRQRSAAGYTKPYVSRIVCEEKIVLHGVVAASGKEKNWVSIIDLYAFIEKEHNKRRERSKGAKKKKKEMFKMQSLLDKFQFRKKKRKQWVEKNLEVKGKGRKIFMKMKTKKK